MTYTGLPRGRRKVLQTIRITHLGGGSSTISFDGGAGSPVTYSSAGWLQLFASTSVNVNFVEIFDSTGDTARFGTGAAASEVDFFQILPGGNGFIGIRIDAGTRITVRPLVTPGAGSETTINFYD